MRCAVPLILVAVSLRGAGGAAFRRLTRADLVDKIRGGWAGQMIGNIQGLPFEFKYKDAPGPLPDFTPNLPRCRSDDDTDIEWTHIIEMDRAGDVQLPYGEVARIWIRSMNRGIWVSNERARELMGQGILPPWTSDRGLNAHARYNLSGQFCTESYGFLSPGMPVMASRLGWYYASITVRGEPIQAAVFTTSMVALAFFERDEERIVRGALAMVDPKSQHAEMVRDVLIWRREAPEDWRATRAKIQEKYREGRGWNMNATITNGAFVVAALLYGGGDFVRTLQLAFALGYDADCNAATCGAVLGVALGARALEAHPGWVLPAHYDNGTRDGLPETMTMDALVEMTARVAEGLIRGAGGSREGDGERAVYRIPVSRAETVTSIDPILPADSERTLRRYADWCQGTLIHDDRAATRTLAGIWLARSAWDDLSEGRRAHVRSILMAAKADPVLGPLAARAREGLPRE